MMVRPVKGSRMGMIYRRCSPNQIITTTKLIPRSHIRIEIRENPMPETVPSLLIDEGVTGIVKVVGL
jgi:hypothetical protein